MNEEKIELPESNTKNRFDELLEKFEISKSEMTNEQLQGFAKAVLKYASSNEEANKYIDQLLADISEREEGKSKFEVGGYFCEGRSINKIIGLEPKCLITRGFNIEPELFFSAFKNYDEGYRKATEEEIKLFKRAEMYHNHGRKLDELKVGDLLKMQDGRLTLPLSNIEHAYWTNQISGNGVEIYLTVEEQQEAYKKIVGE